jgi:hypothetical protein
MKSYIPPQVKQTRERLEVKLERSLIEKLEHYCQYLDSDRDYVIGCVLQKAFKKDKGFAEWLKSHDPARPVNAPVSPAPRRTVA